MTKVISFRVGTGHYSVGTNKVPAQLDVVHRDTQAEDQEPMKAGDWLVMDGEKVIMYSQHYTKARDFAIAEVQARENQKEKMPEKITMADIKSRLRADSYSSSKGVFTVKRNFFYAGKLTEKTFAAAVRKAIKGCEILDSGVVFIPEKESHWFVKFSV